MVKPFGFIPLMHAFEARLIVTITELLNNFNIYF